MDILTKLAEHSRHKGKRRWITVGSAIMCIVGSILALVAFMSGREILPPALTVGILIAGAVILLANEAAGSSSNAGRRASSGSKRKGRHR